MKRCIFLFSILAIFLFPMQVHAASATACVITKVGDPSGTPPPLPSECNTGGVFGDGAGILTWAERITQNLKPALWSYHNNQQSDICNDQGVCAHKQTGSSESDLYWCTYLVVDAFNLAGFKGLTVAAHGAVVYMYKFWDQTDGYTLLPYNAKASNDPQNKEALQKLRPGMPFFMCQADRCVEHTGVEHTGIVKEVTIDERGNGSFKTYESNGPYTSNTITIDGWTIVQKLEKPIWGFGAFEGGGEQNPTPTETVTSNENR